MPNFSSIAALLLSFSVAAQPQLQGELTQGALIRGQVEPGTRLYLNGEPIKVSEQGVFVLGFGRDADVVQQLSWRRAGGQDEGAMQLQLSAREYEIQRITGVDKKYVSPPQSVLDRIKEDNRKIREVRSESSARMDFMQPFIWPAEGPVSGVYGSQRYFNGVPKRPHFGLDIAAPVGAPVVAPAAGKIVLWEPDMYYSGGTLVIDHGYGITSTFIHLDAAEVEVGQEVAQGELVARVGKTGRVTGAHLDWRVNWMQVRLDPALLLPPR